MFVNFFFDFKMVAHLKLSSLAAAVVFSASSVSAAPINLVTNGSFEDGLNGWTLAGVQGSRDITPIFYNRAEEFPIGASGEAVPVDNAATESPDAAGQRGAYLVSDSAVNAGLSQKIFLKAGSYRIGFDAYAPLNGFGQPVDAGLLAQIAGVTLANFLVSQTNAQQWYNYSGLAEIVADGFYDVSFLFNSGPLSSGNSKDVVLDRAYIIASEQDGGTQVGTVPEPGSLALMGLGLLGLVGVRKRKSN